MSKTTEPLLSASNLAFLSGSTAEKQAYARHYAQQSVQDIDVMVVQGSIQSPKALISTHVPGFKQIRYEFVQQLGVRCCMKSTLNGQWRVMFKWLGHEKVSLR